MASKCPARISLWRLAALSAIACAGCSEPTAEPPQDAPWLDASEQIELLKQKDSRLQALAARNLGNLGLQAAEAIPKLEELSRHPNPKVSESARQALEKIRAATNAIHE